MDSGVRPAVQIPARPLNSYIVLGKLFHVPGPQFPHLYNDGNNNPSLLGLPRFKWNQVHKNVQHGFPSVRAGTMIFATGCVELREGRVKLGLNWGAPVSASLKPLGLTLSGSA